MLAAGSPVELATAGDPSAEEGLPEESPASIGQGARREGAIVPPSRRGSHSGNGGSGFGKCHRNYTATGRSGWVVRLPVTTQSALLRGKGEKVG